MGHYNVSADLLNSAEGEIGGLCTPCHDPHGVSPSLGADMEYAVPLLTGTWQTTPYNEDRAPINYRATVGRLGTNQKFNVGRRPIMDLSSNTSGATVEQFAGLCLKCHPQSTLDSDDNATWATSDRIHDAVQGWGSTKHSFTCSKCHTPHANRLPRLLVTNCLNSAHAGQVSSGGRNYDSHSISYSFTRQYYKSSGSGSGSWSTGGSGSGGGNHKRSESHGASNDTGSCHTSRESKSWNNVSPWGTPYVPLVWTW